MSEEHRCVNTPCGPCYQDLYRGEQTASASLRAELVEYKKFMNAMGAGELNDLLAARDARIAVLEGVLMEAKDALDLGRINYAWQFSAKEAARIINRALAAESAPPKPENWECKTHKLIGGTSPSCPLCPPAKED